MLLKLPSRDIQPRQEIIIPGAWCGEAMDVTLDGDRRGRLEATMQVGSQYLAPALAVSKFPVTRTHF